MKKSIFISVLLIVLLWLSSSVSAKTTTTPKQQFQGYLDSFSTLSQKESKENNTKITNITKKIKANNFALITKVYPNVISLTGSKYPWCDTPDLKVGAGVWAMCNIGISKYGNTVWKDRTGKQYKKDYNLPIKNFCANGYHIPTNAEWTSLVNILSTGWKDKDGNFYTTRVKMIMGLNPWNYWIDNSYGINAPKEDSKSQMIILSKTGFQSSRYFGLFYNGATDRTPTGLFYNFPVSDDVGSVRCIKN